MAIRKTRKVLCISACECRLEAGNRDVEQVGCLRRFGWRYRVGLLLQRQAVAIEDMGHDLGDVVDAGGEGRGVGVSQ